MAYCQRTFVNWTSIACLNVPGPFSIWREFEWSGREDVMRRPECSSVSIFLGNLDLPRSAVRVYCQKYRRDAKWVDTFVHNWYRVRILDRHCFQIAVINAKAKSYVLPREYENRWGPLRMRGLDNVYASIGFVFCSSNYLTIGPARYGGEWTGQLFLIYSFSRCCTSLIEPRSPSYMLSSSVRALMICCYMGNIRRAAWNSWTSRA